MQQQFERTRRRYQEFGLDYSGTFYNDGRSVTNVNLILYGRDDPDMKRRVRELFLALVSDAKQLGYGEYRTHLSYMDDVAASFDFNDHALRSAERAGKGRAGSQRRAGARDATASGRRRIATGGASCDSRTQACAVRVMRCVLSCSVCAPRRRLHGARIH